MLMGLSPAKVLVTLPGSDLACVRMMEQMGIIDSETRQCWFERNPTISEHIRTIAFMAHPNVTVRQEEIFRADIPQGCDLLNLDLEESFSPSLGHWLEHRAARSLADEAVIIVTLTAFARNPLPNGFTRWFDDRIERDPALRAMLLDLIRASYFQSRPLMRAVIMTLCSLPGFIGRVEAADEYADTNPMMTFRISLRRSSLSSGLPPMSVLIDEFREQYEPPVKTKTGTSPPKSDHHKQIPRRAPFAVSRRSASGGKEDPMKQRTFTRNREREAILNQIGHHERHILDLKISLRALDEQEQADVIEFYSGMAPGPVKGNTERTPSVDTPASEARKLKLSERAHKAWETRRRKAAEKQADAA